MILPRFYPVLDTATLARRGCPADRVAEGILDAGACILQIRHKGHFSGSIFRQLEKVARLCHDAGALLVINDRVDVARMLGAGLHLGQQDLPPCHARALMGADGVIGFSTHNREQIKAAASEPVDYLAIGPAFATSSKDKPDPVLGVDAIRELRGLATKPLVAIGGITRENARAVLDTGVDSVAVISDLIPELPLERAIRERVVVCLELVG